MDLGRISICRLCATEKNSFLRIYDEEGYKLAIEIKINKYLQIQVDEKDSLPKAICWECYTKLEQYSNFVNNSQNAQITLLKIFPIYNESPLKEENIFSHDNIFNQTNNLLNYNTQQMGKENESQSPFECNNLNLPNTDNNCYYDKNHDYLFEESNKSNIEDNNSSIAEYNNSSDLSMYNIRKRFNKRKCVTPVRYFNGNAVTVRNKWKFCRKKKLSTSKKKKIDSNTQQCHDYTEGESELLRQKYFSHIPWVCTECKENFQTLTELQNHHVNYHLQSSRYMCPYCYKVYMKYPGFASHMEKHEFNNTNAEVVCEQCGKTFLSKRMLKSHLVMHTDKRPFQCTHCEKSFKHQSGLYLHSRCHLPEHMKFGYSCDQCDKNFSTKPNLATHKKIHTGVRNYTCDLCGKSFTQKGNLCAHMLTHSNNKPFTCEICNKEFKTLMQLRKHNNVHTGKKPHQCDVCGRQFRERGTLKEHYRIHTGAMPFSCEFCGKTFRFKGVLTTHRRQHTGERPYSCIECQHHFTNWPNYNKHMKRRHGINTSRANRIKPDNADRNATSVDENINDSNNAIDIPSFEDSLQPVPTEGDKTERIFEETSESHLNTPYLISPEQYDNSTSQEQHNSVLNAYYSMTALQVMNPSNHVIDIISNNINEFL